MAPSWMVFPWYEFDVFVPVEALPPQAASNSANANATPRATLLMLPSVLFPLRLCGKLTATRATLVSGDLPPYFGLTQIAPGGSSNADPDGSSGAAAACCRVRSTSRRYRPTCLVECWNFRQWSSASASRLGSKLKDQVSPFSCGLACWWTSSDGTGKTGSA